MIEMKGNSAQITPNLRFFYDKQQDIAYNFIYNAIIKYDSFL